jgi:hypothetical protein
VTIGIGRGLFRVAEFLHTTAAVILAPAMGTSEHIPIDRLNFARSRSLPAARLPYRAAYYVCFTPAFIFDNLSRGPPLPPIKIVSQVIVFA